MIILRKNESYKRMIMFGCTVVILAALTYLFWHIWFTYYSPAIENPFYRKGNWLIVAVYAMLTFAFSKIYGAYKIGYLKTGEVIYSQILSMIFVNIITYFQISLIGRALLNPLPLLGLMLLDIIAIVLWCMLAHFLYIKLFPPRSLLMVYDNDNGNVESLIHKMEQRPDKYRISKAVNIREGYETIIDQIPNYEGVILCDLNNADRKDILKYCFERSIRIYVTPKISDLIIRGAEDINLFDTPLLLCKNTGLSFEQKVIKRTIDLVASSIALIIASPFMLITALVIKLYDGGPVLFKQKRLTLNKKVFEVYKFRSMIVDAEKDGVARLSNKHDSRITPVGKVIRKIRFDELPQLINIFKGDMSIVGPRPERPEIAEQYKQTMPEFDFRLKVKAGLTGYAQVNGKYNTTPYDKLKLDLMYIEHYSILMDIKLMFKTIKILFMPDSTEGIEDGAVTAGDISFIKHENAPEESQKENCDQK